MPAKQTDLLIIEDDESFGNMIQMMMSKLRGDSYNWHLETSLSAGMDYLNRHECDVVLLDLYLPDSKGLSTIRRLHERHPEVPLIVLTGRGDEHLAQGALTAGAQDYFEKTEISTKLLKRVISYAIERYSLKQEISLEKKLLEKRVRERTSQLEMAEKQWQKTFDAVPDLMAIIDNKHKIIQANKAMTQKLGLGIEEIQGALCYQLMHGKDHPIDGCPHAELLEDGCEHLLETYEEKLGADYLVSTSPLTDEQGRLTGSVHVARDITAIKSVQKALEKSEARYRMFLEQLPDSTIIYDNKGRVLFTNGAFERMFGWSLREIQGKELDFVPPEAVDETKVKVREMAKGNPVRYFRTTRLTKDGRRLTVRINTSPIIDDQKKQSGNIVIMRDITEIVLAQQAARASEERYRMLVENMSEGLSMVNPETEIVFVNEQMASMIGYRPEELIGKSFTEMIDPSDVEIFKEKWVERKEGKSGSYELALLNKNGGTLNTILSAAPTYDKKGRFSGSLALIMDVTKHKYLEMQLMQAQKLEGIGQLAAGIAHEINTPVQYVSNNNRFLIEALDDLKKLHESQKELIGKIKQEGGHEEDIARLESLESELDIDFLTEEIPGALSANKDGLDHIANIVLSMKQFAHPGTDKPVPTDLNKSIENTVTVAKNEWKYHASLQMDLEPDLPLIPCVAGEINQVILNLIVNAAQAIADAAEDGSDEKGRISISSRKTGGHAEIKVSDTGPGIPKEIHHRIFDPFFTTKEPGKGTGQGLAIAYRCIVDNHKGSIEMKSKTGEGTTFIIRLPLEQSAR